MIHYYTCEVLSNECGDLPYESSLMTEVEAIRVAVLICIGKGFEGVHIGSNSKCLVKMLKGKIQLDVVIEGIFFNVKCLKQQSRLVAPRVCNKSTYLVASFVAREEGFVIEMVMN